MVDRLKELGSTCTIITAAASALGKMLIKTCKKEGITPICTVRRDAQAEMLRNEYEVEHVINTSEEDWKQKLGAIAAQAKPSSCLECIAGEMTGIMLSFLGMGGTCILYGLLSGQPASAIDPMSMIGRGTRLEGYILNNDMERKSAEEKKQFMMRAIPLYTSDLSTTV